MQMIKGKYSGVVDIGLSVLTYKRHGRRIDLDAEEVIYHLKVCNKVEYMWGKVKFFKTHIVM